MKDLNYPPLWMVSTSDRMMHAHVLAVLENLGLMFIDFKDTSHDHIIFTSNRPVSEVILALRRHHVTLKVKRFEKMMYKGYHIKRAGQSLALTIPIPQLTHLAHCFKYGAYNHHRPESRRFLVYQSIDYIYKRYKDEMKAIHDYYRYATNKIALAKLAHFAYQSLVCTIAHKYRLTKRCARLKLNQMGYQPFSSLKPPSPDCPYTGEPYTLKGVRTVLREVDSLLTTDPTTHHHLKKIFK